MFKDKIEQEIKVDDYIARPTKSGGGRINEVMIVVGHTPKSVKAVRIWKGDPELKEKKSYYRPQTVTNYAECIVLDRNKVIQAYA